MLHRNADMFGQGQQCYSEGEHHVPHLRLRTQTDTCAGPDFKKQPTQVSSLFFLNLLFLNP